MWIKAMSTLGSKLIPPKDNTLVPIVLQSQRSFRAKSFVAVNLRNYAAPISNAAAGFGAHTSLTTAAKKSALGSISSQIANLKNFYGALERACWAV